MQISKIEQGIACNDEHNNHASEVSSILQQDIPKAAALRLVMLYALRYESRKGNKVGEFKRMLRDMGVQGNMISLIDVLLDYAGASKRAGDLFGNKSGFKKFINKAKKGFRRVENIYTQHTPFLAAT